MMGRLNILTLLITAMTAAIIGTANAQPLTLAESIDIALQNNPQVQIARENMNKAEAIIDEATSLGMPQLNLEGTYQRVDKVAEAKFGDSGIKLGTLDSRTADLVLTQPIDVFGIIKTGQKAAKGSRSVAQYGYNQSANDITLDVKTSFYNVLRAQKFLKVQEDTIAQLEAHLKDAQANYDAGTIAKFDMLRAETQVANARQGLITARNGVELAKSAFNNVLGRPLDTPVELAEPEAMEYASLDLRKCIDFAYKQRPEVLGADTLVDMNEKAVKIAKLSGKPRFNIRWAYNRNFDVTMFSPNETSWRAFLTSSISIFDGGATKAAVDMAESDANNAVSTRDQIVRGVTLDTQQSYLSLKESEERIRAAEKTLEQAREAMRLAQVRYKGGVSTQIEVFDAQAALTLAETNYVNAQYDYQVGLAKIERAVGGKEQFAKLTGGQTPVASDQ